MRRGFTLIELLAAVAILAVVSIMAAQVLGVAVLQRDLLLRRDHDSAALMRALTLLRRDFEAITPLAEADSRRLPMDAAIERGEGGQLRLVRAGLVTVQGPLAPTVATVVWALRDGGLARAQAPVGPGNGAPVFVPVLAGVSGFSVQPYGVRSDAPSEPTRPAPGYEITLQTDAWGPLRLVVAR